METEEYYGGTYPEPFEFDYKHIKAHVCISFDLEFDIEKALNRDEIIEYIEENINDFTWYNQEIQDLGIESEVLPNEE